GKSNIELHVQRGSEGGRAPVVFAVRKSRAQFAPNATFFEHDFQFEVLHAPIRELVFELDARIDPYEVTARQTPLKRWHVEQIKPPAKSPDKGRPRLRLRVQLRDPLLGVLPELQVKSTAPRWPDQETTLPDVAPVRSVVRSEKLTLVFHPDQFLERWEPGSF